MSFMSTTTIKTDVTSKVLPGDKSGLPLEIWQIIFSHLSVRDLCRVGMVSKTWYELSLSIDMTRWKELYLACSEWRHPSWPLNIHREPPSWKNAYREQYLSTRFWLHCARQVQMTGCISLLKRNRERRSIKVGPGLEYQTLKSALAVASEYDQILMHPGIYDEHVEMSLKIPFELIGVGELGSVILVVCIEQIAQTGRLSNLVLRAPWFTTFILKVRSGYLQVDNCIIEGGVVYVQNPATCHIQFCSFRHSSIILQHINAGMVRNCEFSQSDNANIIVEGHVKEEKNWASSKLRQQIIAIFENRQPQIRKHQLKQTDSTTSTLHSNVTGKSFTTCTLKTFDITSNVQAGIPDATTCKQNPIDPERELSANNAEVQEFQYGPQAKHRPMSIGSARHMELPRKDLTLSPKTLMSVQGGKNQHGSSVELSHRLCALDTFTGQEESISEVKCQACRKNSRSSDRQDGELEKKLDGEKNSQRKISRSSISESVSNAEQNICFVSSTEDAESVFHASRSTLDHHHIHRPKPESCASCRAEFGVICETALERSKPITVEGNDGLCHSKEQETILRGFCSEHLPLGSHATLTENFLDSGDATAGSLLQATLSQFQQVSQLLHQHPDSSTSRSKSLDPLLTQKPCSHTASNPSEGDLNKPHTFGDKEPALLLDLGQPKSVSNPDLNSLSDSKKNTLNRSLQANSDEVDNPVAQHSDPEHVREALDIHRECSHLKKTLQDYSQRLPQHNCLADCNDSASQHHLHMLQNHCSVSQQLDNPFPQQQFPAVHQHQQSGRCSSPQESGDHKAQHHPAVDHAGDAAERQSHQSYSSNDTNISDDDDMISILDELDSGRSSSAGESYGNNSTSSIESDSDVEGFFHAGNDYDLSDGEESVIMLPHLRQKHLDISLSANAVNADVGSICSQTTRPIAFSPCQDEDILKYVNQVHGCLIHQCRMTHSKGGVMVSLQAQAFISECDISNVFYGIRCIQNSQIVVMKNRIHHCRTSGIFMRMAACGMIAGNDIHSNNEAGIDIRKNADPIVQNNNIHHGKRSGVVVLGSGHGQIKKNYIHNNAEAGIYILYGGNPTVRENHIFDGKAAGVAVNEGGRGFIFEHGPQAHIIRCSSKGAKIYSNNEDKTDFVGLRGGQNWGGVDIRHGGCPVVSSNTITEGLGDGVVIGDQGQGVIENNVISDNNGCGVWIMSASQPYIHGNQINNNSDAGIMMVNKSDVQHDGNYLVPPVSVGVNHSSRSYSLLGALMEDIPLPTPKCNYTTVQYNNIYHNSGRGMIVELGDKVDILFNAVYANHQDGVWVNQEAPVSVSHNSISNNHGCGVITSMTSSLKIYGNGIYSNCEQGIQCQSNAEIKDNDVVGNQTGGILLESASVCKVHGNRVQSVMGPAVKVGASVLESVVSDNKIFSNGEEDIVNLSKRAVVQGNEILQPYAFGTNGQTRHKGKNPAFAKTDFLNNPPARPHIEPPPPPSLPPAHHISAVTKVMVPSGDSCQQGSKLCCIL